MSLKDSCLSLKIGKWGKMNYLFRLSILISILICSRFIDSKWDPDASTNCTHNEYYHETKNRQEYAPKNWLTICERRILRLLNIMTKEIDHSSILQATCSKRESTENRESTEFELLAFSQIIQSLAYIVILATLMQSYSQDKSTILL